MCAVHVLFSSFFIAFYRILLYDAPKLYKYIQKGDDLLASDDAIQLLALLILVILSAFFSSAETSLTTANAIRLQTLADEGNRRAAVALKVKQNPSKMLSAILIGNNLVNNFAASLTTALAIKLFGQGALGIVTAVLTVIILIFGEITPKTYAAANSEKMALTYASVIDLLIKIMTPVIFVINAVCRFFLKLLHVSTDSSMNPMTEMELRTIVDVSHKDGVIEKEEREMIYNVVDFGDSQAKDVMFRARTWSRSATLHPIRRPGCVPCGKIYPSSGLPKRPRQYCRHFKYQGFLFLR